jgi:biotin operon repressor
MDGDSVATGDETHREIVRAFEALSNPLRVAMLHRLAQPAFAPDLAREFQITRQAVRRHLDAMEEVGLIVGRPARRGALPATEYLASPAGLFAFKENVLSLALPSDPSRLPLAQTRPGGTARPPLPREGPGLLLVHGDAPGRWFPLSRGKSWVLGRDPRDDVPLAYDPFASARHAMLSREGTGWSLTDLHSTNGTLLDFQRLAPGETRPLRLGSVVGVGRSRLIFQDGP